MNLEDKLYDKIQFYVYTNESGYVDGIQDASKQCVQICDEFVVNFIEWYEDIKEKQPFLYLNKTTTELLEIYKQGL